MSTPSTSRGGASAPGPTVADPSLLARHLVLKDGRSVRVRPIEAGDRDRLERFHEQLSDRSVYRRFFYLHRHLSTADLDRFTQVDGAERLALVALDGDAVVAVGRYDRLVPGACAEVAFVVADAWQGRGIASALLALLAAAARTSGLPSPGGRDAGRERAPCAPCSSASASRRGRPTGTGSPGSPARSRPPTWPASDLRPWSRTDRAPRMSSWHEEVAMTAPDEVDGEAEPADAGPPGGVVVGIDGSDGSARAAAWAAEEAAAWGLPLTVVGVAEGGALGPDRDLQKRMRATVDECVAKLAAHHPGLEVVGQARAGIAAARLIDAARVRRPARRRLPGARRLRRTAGWGRWVSTW